jgi:NAD(P)-dependent dehydrogenase (short-subunit alcohol dehydrogenase family)
MANRLAGKIALITGGDREMSAAEARMFAVKGVKALVADVLDMEGRSIADEINRALPGRALYLLLDVTKISEWESTVVNAEASRRAPRDSDFAHYWHNRGVYLLVSSKLRAPTES